MDEREQTSPDFEGPAPGPSWSSSGPTTGSITFEDSSGDGVLKAVSTSTGADRMELIASPTVGDLTARVEVQAWDVTKPSRIGLVFRSSGAGAASYEASFSSSAVGSEAGSLQVLRNTGVPGAAVVLATTPSSRPSKSESGSSGFSPVRSQ